jgi:hypothetical protein
MMKKENEGDRDIINNIIDISTPQIEQNQEARANILCNLTPILRDGSNGLSVVTNARMHARH